MNRKAVIEHIVRWLAGYCEQAGLDGFVTGISGGVDSAVTSALCARTGKPTYAVSLPINQAKEQDELADRHLEWLSNRFPCVSVHRLDLSIVLDSFQQTLPGDLQTGLVLANTKSRIRMIALYAFATRHRLLVAGTGNKVEDFGVGFFTKYGDGGVDLLPIGDLMKSEVRQLAEELHIPPEIVEAVPVDGLWEDQRCDEEQIGATYDELEWAMAHEESGVEDKDLSPRQKEVLTIFRRLNKANRHKMEPIPVARIPDSLKLT